jgi:GNAT superfamily N-acetyltransferase
MINDFRIRKAKLGDAIAIAKVHVDSWRETYAGIVPDDYLSGLSYEQREPLWRKILSQSDSKSTALVVEDEKGLVVGFASAGQNPDRESGYDAELYAIYILREHQRKQIGTRLISEIASRMLKVGMVSMMLWVLARNPYRRFYEALGGEPFKRRYMSFGEAKHLAIAYGWPDISPLARLTEVDS